MALWGASVSGRLAWMMAPAVLAACSFLAPGDRELMGGILDGGPPGVDVPGGSGAHEGGVQGGAPNGGAASSSSLQHKIKFDASTSTSGGAASTGPSGVHADASTPPGAEPDAASTVVVDSGPCVAPHASCPGGCSDTTADPNNCGGCSMSCAAPSAEVSCMSSQCVRHCSSGYADCDHDLAHGASGSGCETNIAGDVANCGACAAPCANIGTNAVFCSNSLCKRYSVIVGVSKTGPLHGGDGGLPFTMTCGTDEVVIGIRGVVSQDSVYGIGANCGRLEIRPDGTSKKLDVVPTSSLPIVGGYPDGQAGQTNFAIPCPPASVVTAVSGATWPPWADTRICVKQLTLSCAAVKLDDAGKLVISVAPTPISAGKQDSSSTAFPADSCGPGGAVTGFSGRNGNLLDALAVECATMSVSSLTQKKGLNGGWLADVVRTDAVTTE